MSKTWLSAVTAAALVLLAVGLFVGRRLTLGADIEGLSGAPSWKVTLDVRGELRGPNSAVFTARPPDFRRQHILKEQFDGTGAVAQLPARARKNLRDALTWRPADPLAKGKRPVRLTYSFRVQLNPQRTSREMRAATHALDAPPAENGREQKPTPLIQADHAEVSQAAAAVAPNGLSALDRARALFDRVASLPDRPLLETCSALECLRREGGDPAARSRLLVALCRNRGIPARLVTGLALDGPGEQPLHHWAEAWVNAHWLPMCPTHGHFGTRTFPGDYLVWQVGDDDVIRTRAAAVKAATVTVEAPATVRADDGPVTGGEAFWLALSLHHLERDERQLVEFLLLLPLAALVVCVARTVIGVPTFGTFTPALIGLAFLDPRSLTWGLPVFVVIVLVGWALRRVLDRYHLLQVPRVSALLTLIVIVLVVLIALARHHGVASTRFVSLFPLIILTHLVERFWTTEAEDGTLSSFRTLLGTVAVAVAVSLLLSPDAVRTWMYRYPETLGVVLAATLLLGRYTGYRLSELYRFEELLQEERHGLADALAAPAGAGGAGDERAERADPGPEPALAVPAGGQQDQDARPVPTDRRADA